MKEEYGFSMNSIQKDCIPDGKIPVKYNDNAYLTNEEFKTFSSSCIRKFTEVNKKYTFPIWMWLLFSILKKVKLATCPDINISFDNQLRSLVRNISTIIRNGICSNYTNILNMHQPRTNRGFDPMVQIEKEIKKTMKNNNELVLYDYFDEYPSRKRQFLETISCISLLVYKDASYQLSNENSNFKKVKKYVTTIEKMDRNKQEESVLDIILSSKIVRNKETIINSDILKEKERIEWESFKNLIGNNIVNITSNEIHTILEKKFGVKKRWKIFDIINYQLLNGKKDIVFGVNQKLNIESIKVDEENENSTLVFGSSIETPKKRKRGKYTENQNKKQKVIDSSYENNNLYETSNEEIPITDYEQAPIFDIEKIRIVFTFQNRFNL